MFEDERQQSLNRIRTVLLTREGKFEVPDLGGAHVRLGDDFSRQGASDKAARHYRRALSLKPDDFEAHTGLGIVLGREGKPDEAMGEHRGALAINPSYASAHSNLAALLRNVGRFDEALAHFQEALRLRPDWPYFLNDVAGMLATHPEPSARKPQQAIRLAERACELTRHENPVLLDTLAIAYASAGQFDRAVKTAEAALKLATGSQTDEVVRQIRGRLEAFKRRAR